MCGIVGFVNDKKNKKKIIKNMADRIIHRGPDAEGYYTDDLVALGHRRLSIIDVSSGIQPMYNETGDIVVIFNGEIYNYKALKKELESKHHEFKTNSDTEVLVHGYEEWGVKMLDKLRGMFAFAIWDKKEEKLFCARDNFGIKPFYYYQNNGTFMFASEIKCFLDHPDFEKKLNKDLLAPFLTFSFTPTTETFFEGVNRLDAGHYLEYQNGKLEITRYYKLEWNEEVRDYDKTVKIVAKTMETSVEHHLESDVEIGSFLSSGIDSSYIVSLARPDKTYTVGYDIKRYNEIEYAEDLANRLGLKNISKKINKEEYMNIVPKIMYHMDEPFCDAASIALYFLAELAHKDVKVVLSGEGADEFFAGYNTYRETVDMGFYNKIPYFLRHSLAVVLGYLPEFRGRNFLVRRGTKFENEFIGMNRVFSDKEAKKVLAFTSSYKNKDITKDVYQEHQDKDDLIKMQAIDINFWLIKDILHKADRMTMANSLELRVPFIDKEVFKVASSLRKHEKVTHENTKVALRDAAKKVIPNESYKKKKLGFPVPLRAWMAETDVHEDIRKTFSQEFVGEFFNQNYILKLLDNSLKAKKDTYKKVWAIYAFIKWYEVFFLDKLPS